VSRQKANGNEDFYVPFIAILQKLKAALIQINKKEVPFQRFFQRIGNK
jgi:hypothetical protein